MLPAVSETLTRQQETESQPLMVSPRYIESTMVSLELLRDMVRNVLVRDRDYGRVPGIPGDFLWDPGASTIISSFNCHAGARRILRFVDDGNKIALVIEVPILNNATGREVGSGIGASSTQETKHKYRWEANPQEWGFDEEAMKSMKTRLKEGKQQYRIPNPEHGELLNTLTRMASKRAEVDAAQGLPAVGSALRELFSGWQPKGQGKVHPEPDDDSPRWTAFWSQVKALGIEPDKVHQMLGVTSMKDWLKQGKSLDDAIKVLADKIASGEVKEPTRDPETLQTVDELFDALFEDFGMKEADVLAELNCGSREDLAESFASPSECYQRIASVRESTSSNEGT